MVNWFSHDKKSSVRKLERSGRPLRQVGKVEQTDVDGTTLSYWRVGAAENTIVFIHGNSACKEVFREQFNTLNRPDLSLLAIDLPGHGCSMNASHPEETYTMSGYALVIKKLLDKLGISRPILVGWSLGGHIAIEMAGRGFGLAGLVLCGTPPAGPGLKEMTEAFTPGPLMAVATTQEVNRQELRSYTEVLYAHLSDIPQHFLDAAWRTDGRARRIMGEHWASGMEGCHQKTVIAGWKHPICVMHGTDEQFFSIEYLEDLEWRNLWRKKIHSIARAGHAPFIEAPEAYNNLLIQFAHDIFQGTA